MSTLGDDAHGLPQIKIWLQRFRTGDLSCSDLSRAGRPPLTSGPQVEAFRQKYPFASTCIIANYFLTTSSTVKEILQRELGMRNFSRRWVPHSMSDAQNVARVEAAKETLRICRNQKRMILMASQQATSLGFNTPRRPRKCLPVRQQMSFRGRGRKLARKL
jgi:hypothetical protein